MKNSILLLSLILTSFIGIGQCPTTDVLLTTQADIDNFATNYPGCTILTHAIWIDGDLSNITNLNGLAAITSAQDIQVHSTQISDFSGLNNLESVSHLSIWFNNSIENLEGLTSLQSIGSLDVFLNVSLIDLSGLDSIQSIENLFLFTNTNLRDISQLSFLETINSLAITANGINSLEGLENLHTVEGDLEIGNEALVNFDVFTNLQTIGGSLYIMNNELAEDISAFSNLNSLGDLFIVGCSSLTDFTGLENIQTISGRLRIGFNPGLYDLSIFSNITSVGNLDIYENDNLVALAGFENLQHINDRLLIHANDALVSIKAIDDVSTSQINEVIIAVNNSLSICNNPFTCAVMDDPNINKIIYDNNVGCNSIEEVITSCLLSIEDQELSNLVTVYPNPVSEILQIDISEGLLLKKITVFSILGQQLMISTDQNINFSSLSQGVYFVEVTTDQGSITKKVIRG